MPVAPSVVTDAVEGHQRHVDVKGDPQPSVACNTNAPNQGANADLANHCRIEPKMPTREPRQRRAEEVVLHRIAALQVAT